MGTLFRTLGLCAGLGLALPAHAAGWMCRHISLSDAQSGAGIVGIEDIAVDEGRGVAYLSAYNRRTGDHGAIYALSRDALAVQKTTVHRLQPSDGAPLRPHGIALESSGHLLVIDRVGTGENYHPIIRHFAIEGGGLRLLDLVQAPDLCHANDLLPLSGGGLLISNDHRACDGVFEWVQRILGLPTGEVLRAERAQVHAWADDIRFPNGLAQWNGEIIVSATRADALYRYDLNGERLGEINLPGSPDNLSVGRDGALYFTVFPSLIGYARFRSDEDGREAAPTHVLRLMPGEGEATDLELPSKDLPAGGTVAAPFGDWLLIGSAFDYGLGVCEATS